MGIEEPFLMGVEEPFFIGIEEPQPILAQVQISVLSLSKRE
jgi:hypothetical protein